MRDLKKHIEQQFEKLPYSYYFLGCSGGVDSMTLAHVFVELKIPFELIHVNYHLRGEESNLDEELVRTFSKLHGVKFQVRSHDVNQLKKPGENIQNLARQIRYDWFKELSASRTNSAIVLGHHRDDQIETFFLHLARKSGVMGLAAMPFQRDNILRPLLDISKAKLYHYAKTNKVPWREDRSNESIKYRRNLLRNKILPELRKEFPDLDESVLILVQHFQLTQQELETRVRPVRLELEQSGKWSVSDFEKTNEFERIELFRQWGQPASLVQELETLTTRQKGKELALIDTDKCPFSRIVKDRNCFVLHQKTHLTHRPVLICKPVTALPSVFDKHSIYLDKERIQGTLKVRPWRQGDRISGVGIKGSTLISKIIADAKIPTNQKASVLVVHDDRNIHWCVGLKIGKKAIADNQTTHIIQCTIIFEAPQ